ncbi:MAG: magnesium/cobalt transporter CorA [Ktedonobacterales bacterium]
MQLVLVWRNKAHSVDVSAAELAAAISDPKALVWLDVSGDLTASRELLTGTLHLSTLTVDAIVDTAERARFVAADGYFYLIVHCLGFDATTSEASTPKLDVVFGKNFLVTAHVDSMPWLDTLWTDICVGKTEENFMSRGVAHLLYAVLDTLVDSYFPVLDELDDIIDDLENITVATTSNEVQGRIFRIKRSLALMRRVISPQVEVANSLITRTGDIIPREAEPYFAEVHDHLVRAFEVLDSYRDLMSGLLDVYLTTVSNRLNVVMKQLAIIATIFMPITFVTGFFGQNFGFMPQVAHDGGYNFVLVLLFMAAITAFQIWYFKRRGWF